MNFTFNENVQVKYNYLTKGADKIKKDAYFVGDVQNGKIEE